MATRKKKKQRTIQLMASAALLSTTVAPYVISAEEVTKQNVDPISTTDEALQNPVAHPIQPATTPDSVMVSPVNENTTDNESEIISSGGNTDTESIGDGTTNFNTFTELEAINQINLNNVTLTSNEVKVPAFTETHAITLNFQNEKQTEQSVMDGYVNDAAVLGLTADGKKYVQMTIPKDYKGWITGFKSTMNGQLQDSIVEEKEDGTTVYTFEVESFERSAAWVKVDITMINYHHEYTVYLDFPNIAAEYTELGEATEPSEPTIPNETVDPEKPTTPVEPPIPPVEENTVKHLATPDSIVVENAPFTFATGDATIDGYMGSYIKKAAIVEIGGKLFADIELTGNTYAYTSIKFDSLNGDDVPHASNGLTGKDLVRTIRIPLDENKKSSRIAMYSDLSEDGKRAYENMFTFDFVPAPKVDVTTAADLTSNPQAIKFAYSSTPEWQAAAFPSNIKAASAKAVNGKVEVTLQVATEGLEAFKVTQKGKDIATWANTSSLVTFTVDSLDALAFTLTKTSSRGTSEMSVNVDEVSLNTSGTLPVETIVTMPEQPTSPTGVPTFTETHSITLKFKNDKQTETSVMDQYINDKAVLGITANGKKYVQMTIPKDYKGWVTGFKPTINGKLQDSFVEVKADGTTVYTFEIESFSANTAWVKVDIDSINYHHDYTVYLDFPNIENEYKETVVVPENAIPAPTKPSQTSNEIVKKPNQFELKKPTPISFNFGAHTLTSVLKQMIASPSLTRINDREVEIKFAITPKNGVSKIRFMQNGKEIGSWSAASPLARVASLTPFFAASSNEVTLKTTSLEGITFEVVEANGNKTNLVAAVETAKSNVVTTNPGVAGGGTVVAPKPTPTPTISNLGNITKTESISYTMKADPNGPMADFITGYLAPYFSNAEVVTVDGKNYIQLTLTGKAYGFAKITATGGGKIVSSVGEKMDQVRIFRFPAAKDVTIFVDSGELGYGAYNLFFKFDLSEEQIKLAAEGTGAIIPVQTITPQIVSEGDVKFTIPAEASSIVSYAKKLSAKLVDGKYKIDLTLSINADLNSFIVKQGDKEIAKWDKKDKTVLSSNVTTDNLSFTVDSLEDITFIASTKNRTITAKVGAEPVKKEEVKPSKDGRQAVTYTMEADPNGPMADFITGYLAPYFSDAVYVTVNGKPYVEMTLTGKAYGFQTLQYIDENGKNVNIEIISSKGEKMDQVRVIRLPLIQDEKGITKIFVDSGDLGYGAYTLFFKFNVPSTTIEQSNETATTISNPFSDIDNIYSKDDILALYKAGITTGTSKTTFSPNADMTRAQFAVMIARTLEISSTKDTHFKDVKGQWFEKEVQALYEAGIINGVSDTKFKPHDKITRQQAAVMIHNMMEQKGYKNISTSTALDYSDSAKISDYAKEALAELQAQGIMTGTKGKVNPKKNLTRAQMAKILKNAADLVGILE